MCLSASEDEGRLVNDQGWYIKLQILKDGACRGEFFPVWHCARAFGLPRVVYQIADSKGRSLQG